VSCRLQRVAGDCRDSKLLYLMYLAGASCSEVSAFGPSLGNARGLSSQIVDTERTSLRLLCVSCRTLSVAGHGNENSRRTAADGIFAATDIEG